ncbi:Sodium-dependent phosphate transport protein 1, chloroplastic [Coccomyxa sp. Obi]|nr:Sodium-dependent phosphate transport protein 1, chloroplastic [Coccomyxa sp. Obi]
MPRTVRQRCKLQWHAGIHPPSNSDVRSVKTNAALRQLPFGEVTSAADGTHDKWMKTVIFFAGAMAVASAHRVTFSVLAVPLQRELGLSLPQMGILQSAVLAGYILGQIPLGVVADRIGGTLVMHISLFLWSAVTGLTAFVHGTSPSLQFPGLLLARFALGLSQSCIMPATSAMAARCLPQEYRGRALSFIYAASSLGVVAGLLCFPVVAAPLGWPAALVAFAAGGLLWVVFGALTLPQGKMPPLAPVAVRTAKSHESKRGAQPRQKNSSKSNWFQVLVLCWTHCVIGWGFFIFQAWMPSYLHSMGAADLGSMGMLSALPWAASAFGGLGAGWLADHLHESHRWELARVRGFTQTIATIGPAVSLVPLIVTHNSCGLRMAVVCLTAFMGLQAFCYSGFHAYVQDVAPKDAGKLLGLSNSAATVVGMAGNVVTGGMAASTWGYSGLFALTALLYTGSCLTWNMCMKGQHLTVAYA